ncbi:MarR family transcriptional regulator [Paenibacillus sp. Marseille-Q4541]|uniref:MarR family winged helix-turn-helix transcriptional regulator n=1 Tax=Paenibacillus sp. Marseille-Q4541 TaxID=2831522 RepID=UPI001BA89AC5|nr:MarR family transcriptional regulator [Paenibacillus sp. Marseille-Q4541]
MNAHRTFFHKYFLLYRPFVSELNRMLEVYQLHNAQWSIMYYLDMYQSTSLVELSKHLYVEKPTITRTVMTLLKLEYVEQIPVSDKREKRIQLSERGKEVTAEIRKLLDEYEKKIMEGVSAEEQSLVIQVMDLVRNNIIEKGD